MATTYKGKTIEQLKTMSLQEFMQLVPSVQRRSLKRGLSVQHKKLLAKVEKAAAGALKKPIKTHLRDMMVTPQMIGLTLQVHSGKEFLPVIVTEEMLGHRLGEFSITIQKVQHSAPGIGATKSSTAIAAKAK